MTTGFLLGRLVATPGAMALANQATMTHLLARHASGDWGDVDYEDWAANDRSAREGSRILSAYHVGTEKLWMITEADRSVTTFLLPSEY
jgi:hypothetical protein